MLTKADFISMKEDQLCKQVLIPLLRAMKFNDVMYYHGGEGEKGKDIVCWKEDELRTRLNYALVVKSQKITGQAKSARGTAGEVATQIQQAFGSSFVAPITAELSSVHICWVVTNKEITKQGADAIRSIIKSSNYERHVKFIDGDTLWDLVEKHLGNHTVWGKMEDIQKAINQFDTHYSPEVFLDGDQIRIGLKEKFNGASIEKPLDIRFSFEFPKTKQGMLKSKELEKFYATGSEFSIPSEYIKSFEIPDVLRPIFDFDITKQKGELIARPLPSDHHFIASVEFLSDDGDVFMLDYIDFQLQQSGAEESTLKNVEKKSIFRIKLVINSTQLNMKTHFKWKLDKPFYSCSQLLQIYEFQNCVSKPFTMKFYSKEYGTVLITQKFEKGISKPPSLFYLRALRSLLVLQNKSNKVVNIPIREFTAKEISLLKKLIEITTSGRIHGKWTSFNLPLKNIKQEGFEILTDRATNYKLVGSEIVRIFDAKLSLGQFDSIYHKGKISNLEEVRKKYDEQSSEIELYLTAEGGEADFEKVYFDFLKKGDAKNATATD